MNNTHTSYAYDNNGALTSMTTAGAVTTFEYGANQLVTKVTPPASEGLP